MRVCICDDTAADRKRLLEMLRGYCAGRNVQMQVEQFPDGGALLRAFSPGKYQLLFLDIYMPGLSGMEAAQAIREADPACLLVFTTTSEDHALESYGVYAAGYLLKPYGQAQLYEAMDWCMENLPPQAQTLALVSEREHMQVPVRDILYIEVYGRASVLHTTGRTYTANRSLTALARELPADFLRCHRSYIVNMNHIAKVAQNGFVLKDRSLVPISVETGAKMKQSFFDWMFKRTWEGR